MKYILSIVLMIADGKLLMKSKTTQYGYVRPILTTRVFPFNKFLSCKIFR